MTIAEMLSDRPTRGVSKINSSIQHLQKQYLLNIPSRYHANGKNIPRLVWPAKTGKHIEEVYRCLIRERKNDFTAKKAPHYGN